MWENYIQTGGTRLIAVRHRLNQALRLAAFFALCLFVRRVGIKAIKRELVFFLLVSQRLLSISHLFRAEVGLQMRYQDLMGVIESIRGE